MRFPFGKKRIYADWAATTPVHPHVARAMRKTRAFWANPSAIHAEGVRTKRALESARTACARLLSAKPDELYFTSGGTESNATVIRGVVSSCFKKGIPMNRIHIIGTVIEHSSVLETLRDLERQGVSVSYVGVNGHGVVGVDDVMAALRPETVLVTCMYANNEIGTIQPVSKIGSSLRKVRSDKVGMALVESDVSTNPLFPVFHSDASQAPLWLSCDLEGLRVDALTLDAHKMQGPKGVGMLVLKRGVPCDPLMVGGGQERGMRPTTESVELATGLAEALKIAHEGREERCASALRARDAFARSFAEAFPDGLINGSLDRRLPNNINVSLPNLGDAEFAVIKLDRAGIACSTKSSCLKGEEASYVVSALGGPAWRAQNTLRFSFDPRSSASDVKRVISTLRLLA